MGDIARAAAVWIIGAFAVTALTACGGSSGTPAAVGTPTAAVSTTAVRTTAVSTPSSTPSLTPDRIWAETFKLALPTGADLGVPASGYDAPVADAANLSDLNPIPNDIACNNLSMGGDPSNSRSFAYENFIPAKNNTVDVAVFYADGQQYGVGGGATELRMLEQKAHDPSCATWKYVTAHGTTVDVVETVKAAGGLGDRADLFKEVKTYVGTGNTFETDVLVVRYGDTVIVVKHGDLQDLDPERYDLAGRVKAFAAKLGLH